MCSSSAADEILAEGKTERERYMPHIIAIPFIIRSLFGYYVGDIVSIISGEVADPEDVDILRTSESAPGGCAGWPSEVEVAPSLQFSSM